MRILIVFFLLFVSSAVLPTPIMAKRLIHQGKKPNQNLSRIIIKPKIRSDRLALIVNFNNLDQASSILYELTYEADGIPQGVRGTITPAGENSTQRELLFGTCSRNVCTYHQNIKNMKFTATSTLKSGGKVIKPFRVKV